ncbi:UDP-2,3-diacylglucosamine hydrolase [Salipiger pallidus]|uniref:UDP-2,3-diacylglucosamine hydrolase n=1 Tax=Salipiger pallidus TaxID=1775170 RepID=A0A8J2ZJB5_9RHOB|nr:UDP-2,3-diacylglucosamine diphosphatase [Salipiger pallidus]GGG71281.1 UDP-2,3-diacylglucosamine hydrolase [Salipiger pallidus]
MSAPAACSAPRGSLRSLFLSDLHLGARASRPRQILEFLSGVEAETIYLVGDIFDLWHGGRVFWSDAHEAVLANLRARKRDGARIIYLPGNHDCAMRAPDAAIEGWELREAVIHRAADGRRMLVLHGDQCDPRFLRWHFMTRLGSRLDAILRQADDWQRARGGLARDHASHAQRIITGANHVLAMGDRFERRLLKLARASGAMGVICGHSHKPALRSHDGLLYANCGDWIDSLTALTEDSHGQFDLVEFLPEIRPEARPQARPSEAPLPTPLPRPTPGGPLSEGVA